VRIARDAYARDENVGRRMRFAVHIFLGLHGLSDVGYRTSGPIRDGMMADRAARARGTFPLVGSRDSGLGHWEEAGPRRSDHPHSCGWQGGSCASPHSGYVAGGLQLGLGGGFTADGAGVLAGTGGGVVSGQVIGSPWMMGDEMGMFFTGSADLRAAVGAAADRPVYQVRFEGAFNGAQVMGVWVGLEANQFASLHEEILRLGDSVINIPVHLARGDYMLVRIGAGASFLGAHADRGSTVSGGAGYGGTLTALLRLGAFFLDVRGSYDHGSTPGDSIHPGGDVSRVSVEASLSYMMSLIFPNDAIRIDARHVRYLSDAWASAGGDISQTTLGAYYEVRF
jgi:hypothetical protein